MSESSSSETYYLDASVALRVLLGHSPTAARWIDEAIAGGASVISSRLLRTEITRVLRREGIAVSLRDELLDYVATVPLDDVVLAEAEAIVPHVQTLDAIHLTSAISTGLDVVIVTHDETMKSVAEIIGYRVHDPVGE